MQDDIIVDCAGDITSAKSITIPAGAASFGDAFADKLFHDMTSISKVFVEKGNRHFSALNGVLYNRDKTALIYYPRNKHRKVYHMPDTVKEIGQFAFTDGKVIPSILSDVFISQNVKSIPTRCFANTGIWSVYMPATLTSICDEAFIYTNLVCPTLPNDLISLGRNAFKGCKRMHLLNIANENFIVTKDTINLPEDCMVIVETAFDIDHSKYIGLNVMNLIEMDKWLDS